jgi:protein-S-isoprenylcysteine O-methyltransferase Ste14
MAPRMSGLWAIAIYAAVLVAHRALPARNVDGYVRDASGAPLRYRLNGLLVFALTMITFVTGAHLGWWHLDVLYEQRWSMLCAACVLGLVVSVLFLAGASPVKGLLADFYLGRRENPRAFAVDAKMYLYLAGATMLGLNLVSFASHAGWSAGVIAHLGMFGFFLVDYLSFEEVHLYTYDLFAERVAFKLGWGCLVFYPYFYAIGLWSVAERGVATSGLTIAIAVVVFTVGWVLARGANLQKFLFKKRPHTKLLGLVPQEAIEGEGKRLLVSGFWGLSRHVNYLGEILMASGLALALGFHLGPWLYPLYYVALLVPRQIDDDARCARKYGALWDDYRRRVRWRIIPGVY